MTKGTAKVFATESAVFPAEIQPEIQDKVSFPQTKNTDSIERKTTQKINESRFARLKKNLRKKSVSIL